MLSVPEEGAQSPTPESKTANYHSPEKNEIKGIWNQ